MKRPVNYPDDPTCPDCNRHFFSQAEFNLHKGKRGVCMTERQINDQDIWRSMWGWYVMIRVWPDEQAKYRDPEQPVEPEDDEDFVDDLI